MCSNRTSIPAIAIEMACGGNGQWIVNNRLQGVVTPIHSVLTGVQGPKKIGKGSNFAQAQRVGGQLVKIVLIITALMPIHYRQYRVINGSDYLERHPKVVAAYI